MAGRLGDHGPFRQWLGGMVRGDLSVFDPARVGTKRAARFHADTLRASGSYIVPLILRSPLSRIVIAAY
jgi:hypothetical protein